MPFLDSKHNRAAALILLLGLGLAVALAPYTTGIIGAPVLYVLLAPLHRRLARRVPAGLAAMAVILLGVFLIIGPGVSLVGLVASEARDIAGGVIRHPILGRLSELRIGQYEVGPQLAGLGERAVNWIGTSAFGLLGTAARVTLNLTIAFFGLYYLLLSPEAAWKGLRPYIPFSAGSADRLRQSFRDVTNSTVIGLGVTAALQGLLVGLGFWAVGLGNAFFWGVVTAVFSVLPVVGSGLIWGPGVLALVLDGRVGAAVALGLLGAVLIANVDNVIRPWVYSRWAKIHPLVTIVGALAGIRYFGLLGILIGPLALSYFFELIRMYREEYMTPAPADASPPPAAVPVPGPEAAG